MSGKPIERLSRYVFIAPDWRYSLIPMLIISIIIGAVTFGRNPAKNIEMSIILLVIPAVAAFVATTRAATMVGGEMTPNRSGLLAVSSTVIVALFLIVSRTISTLTNAPMLIFDGYVMALALIIGWRMIALLAVSKDDPIGMLLPASLQTLAAIIFLPLYVQDVVYYVNLLIGGVIFLAAVCLIALKMDADMRKSFGVSGLKLLRAFLGVRYGSKEMEELLLPISDTAEIPVSVLSFMAEDKIKATFVIPDIHPGPVGSVGSGDIPSQIAAHFDGTVFPFHGAATHDLNLVSGEDIPIIIDAAKEALASINYSSAASKSLWSEKNDVKMIGQRFDDSALFSFTMSPLPSDDIESELGNLVTSQANNEEIRRAALIDAHNCGAPGAVSPSPGTALSNDMMCAGEELAAMLASEALAPIKMGAAHREAPQSDEIGELGINVAVIEVNEQRTGYVLIDGNNLVPELREKIVGAMPVDNAEVMTTDNHSISFTSPYDYVGVKTDEKTLIDVIRSATEDAINDLKEVQAGIGSATSEQVRIFGANKTAQLEEAANLVIRRGRGLTFATMSAAFILSILGFNFAHYMMP